MGFSLSGFIKDTQDWTSHTTGISINKDGISVGSKTIVSAGVMKPLMDIEDKASDLAHDIGDIGTATWHGDWTEFKSATWDAVGSYLDLVYTVGFETWVEYGAMLFGIEDEEVLAGGVTRQKLFDPDKDTINLTAMALEYTTNNTCMDKSYSSDVALNSNEARRSLHSRVKGSTHNTELIENTSLFVYSSVVGVDGAKEVIDDRFGYDCEVLTSVFKQPTVMEVVMWELHTSPSYDYTIDDNNVMEVTDSVGDSLGAVNSVTLNTKTQKIEIITGVYIDGEFVQVGEEPILVDAARPVEQYLVVTFRQSNKVYVHCIHSTFKESSSVDEGKSKYLNITAFPVVPLRVGKENLNGVEDSVYTTAYAQIEAGDAPDSAYGIQGNKYVLDEYGNSTGVVDPELYSDTSMYKQVDTFLYSMGLNSDALLETICKAPTDSIDKISDAFVVFQFNPLEDSDAIRKMMFVFAARMHSNCGVEPGTTELKYDPNTQTTISTYTPGRANASSVSVNIKAYSYNSTLAYTSVYTVETSEVDDGVKVGTYEVCKVGSDLVVSYKYSETGRHQYYMEKVTNGVMISNHGKTAVIYTTLLTEDEENDEAKGILMFPLIESYLAGFSPIHTEDIMLRSIHLVMYQSEIQEIAYYEDPKFAELLQVVATVVGVVLTIVAICTGQVWAVALINAAVGIAIGEILKFAGKQYASHLARKTARAEAALKAKIATITQKLEEAMVGILDGQIVDTKELVDILMTDLSIKFEIEDQIAIALGEASYVDDPMYSISSKFCIEHKLGFMGE